MVKFVVSLIFAVMATTAGLTWAEDRAKPVYYTMNPPFVTNFGQGKKKLSYVKTEISLRTLSADHLEMIKAHEPLIRHQIVMLLSRQTHKEMGLRTSQETIRVAAFTAASEAVSEEIGDNPIEDLLFTSFLVQH